MVRRRLAETSPPTLTSTEVSAVFFNSIKPQTLQYLDERRYLRPSFYFQAGKPGNLISREDRDLLTQNQGRKRRGDPHRRFTYEDLVCIRLFVYVKERLEVAKAKRAQQTAGDILRVLRERSPHGCPPAGRLIFFGRQVYLLEDSAVVSLLDGQLVLTQVLTDSVIAEVKGRIETLVSLERIRPIPLRCSPTTSERLSA
jgi:hypothetical protein